MVEALMQPAPPRVSCIMPTRDRRRFVPLAIDYFLRQDYPNRELIVVDDGRERIADLLPADVRVRYVATPKASIGAKRNAALREASGAYVAHWDDDDWYAPGRLSRQIAPLAAGKADVVALSMRHAAAAGGRVLAMRARPPRADPPPRSRCGTMVYRREWWSVAGPTQASTSAKTSGSSSVSAPTAPVERLDAEDLFICVRHGRNTWRIVRDWTKPVSGWTRIESPPFLPGRDDQVYRELAAGLAESSGRGAALRARNRSRCMSEFRNVFACLVHENQECVIDLVRNLRYLDPGRSCCSITADRTPGFQSRFPFEEWRGRPPNPRPLAWGRLHDFALDCMQFAIDRVPFDAITIVDSDQLGARHGYSAYSRSSSPPIPMWVWPATRRRAATHDARGSRHRGLQGAGTLASVSLALRARRREVWALDLLAVDRVQREGAHDLTRLFATDQQLQEIMGRSQIWASEEVVFPTIVSLLAIRSARTPAATVCQTHRVAYHARHGPGDDPAVGLLDSP
jgi:glycosyltransferase involved in cell wall biosynthesis